MHQFKFGIDYRRLSPKGTQGTGYGIFPAGYAALVAGEMNFINLDASTPFSANANNYSIFAQDTWRATSHLTLTFGLRWEINTPPLSATAGQPLYVMEGIFDSNPVAMVPENSGTLDLTISLPGSAPLTRSIRRSAAWRVWALL